MINSKTYNPDCDFDPDQLDLDGMLTKNPEIGEKNMKTEKFTEIYHVVPEEDLKPHSINLRVPCKCCPRLEKEGGGLIVIHNAWDGREFFEWTGRTYVPDPDPFGDKEITDTIERAISLLREGMDATGTSTLHYHKMRAAVEILTPYLGG